MIVYFLNHTWFWKKIHTFQNKTTNKGDYIMKFGKIFKAFAQTSWMNTPLKVKICSTMLIILQY